MDEHYPDRLQCNLGRLTSRGGALLALSELIRFRSDFLLVVSLVLDFENSRSLSFGSILCTLRGLLASYDVDSDGSSGT